MKGRALIQVNLAVFLFGTAGLFAKWLDLPAIAITLGRVVFSSLALGLFALVTRQSLRVKGRDFFLLVLGGNAVFPGNRRGSGDYRGSGPVPAPPREREGPRRGLTESRGCGIIVVVLKQ